jgi:hypothetical protein
MGCSQQRLLISKMFEKSGKAPDFSLVYARTRPR